ncbi:hypothetical protein ASPTUDRAFT_49778 [Aspergillus tubingensis CBS 134.48]|uniref:Uncharacterized protein n=1 Tax=Aspergillus tubingensis (strain CBS 134.48) TaxID=767770 RepID=A0A1L9NHU2_ASPTC|nr:hypothetical protein ASPTUDRAFT_49778 [Aspergillus tubingensis CBS 134.48]
MDPSRDHPESVSASAIHHPHRQDNRSVAIIGMGFCDPGDATNVGRLWGDDDDDDDDDG